VAFYDVFLNNPHTWAEQSLMVALNRTLLAFLLRTKGEPAKVSLLEIGPGKGYFHAACKEQRGRVEYTAVDRSASILAALGAERTFVSDAARLPDLGRKFDIIYAGYVIEHLASGQDVYEFLASCRANLAPGGLLALAAPDCMKMGFEFWNIDYTHMFPTTKRNLTMALAEAGFARPRIVDVNGLLTVPGFDRQIVYRTIRALMLPYRYGVPSRLAGFLYRRPLHDLGNVFYRLYCLAKEENMIALARMDDRAVP
jgi:SAM-dependent methyltransferase